MSYIGTEEGRLVNTGTTGSPVFVSEYYLKDHLGNTRVSFLGKTLPGNVIEVTGKTDYYPFGLAMSQYSTNIASDFSENKYLYNGKEIQDDKLNGTFFGWLDYGARFYDPQIGRWHSIDPLAEIYDSQSPYCFTGNNPVLNIDYNGMNYDVYNNGVYTHTVETSNGEKSEQQKKQEITEIPGVIITGDLSKCKVQTPELRRELRRRKRFYKREAKYLKWLSEGKIRQADNFENWVLRNFSQDDIEELIAEWPWKPDYTDGLGGGNRDLVESDEVFVGKASMMRKLKKKYGDAQETEITDAKGQIITDTNYVNSLDGIRIEVDFIDSKTRKLTKFKFLEVRNGDTTLVNEYNCK